MNSINSSQVKKQYKKIFILIILAFFVLASGFQCKCQSEEVKEKLKPITLNYWRAWDDTEDFSNIINAYRQIHPNITINYRKLRYQEYEQALIEAWAEDRGPDIFAIRNTWTNEYAKYIYPLPATISMAYQYTKTTLGIKNETLVEVRETKSITPAEVKNDFLDVVYQDAVVDNKIYGLPLSVDTLIMFYNRNLLNNAGISLPPNDWQQFQGDVNKISLLGRDNTIIQAGTALGTGTNIDHAADIISLLMMQNGARMVNASNAVTFHKVPAGSSNYNPGIEAIRFYTDFAIPSREVYSWNSKMPSSRQAFAQGLVGFYFGFSSDIEYIKSISKNKLNYGMNKMPQIEGNPEINFANYWLETVSKKSQYKNEAWDFIQFATQAKQVEKYLKATGRPTALLALVDSQKNNDSLKIFASQLLTTQSWYRGIDAKKADNYLIEMADSIVNGTETNEAAKLAAERIQQTMR